MATEQQPRVVIVGGGIIGASIAYYLTEKNIQPLIIERNAIACAASGRAGGFLACDWCYGTDLDKLARGSYELHKNLKDTIPIEYDYRELTTLSFSNKGRIVKDPTLPEWIDGNLSAARTLGTTETTAQIHPYKFTNALIQIACQRGATVQIATVEGIEFEGDSNDKVTGVIVNGAVIPADVVVIAMGPWSYLASNWFPIPSVYGQKAHTIIVNPPPNRLITPHALFIESFDEAENRTSFEIYPRPDGQVFICGMSEAVAKTSEDLSVITPTPDSCANLKRLAGDISSVFRESEIIFEKACVLPISERGNPIIGQIPGITGAYIASGHSCWGILLAPATGLAMAELIAEGSSSTFDLEPFGIEQFL